MSNIRNVALLSHSGAGKTSLVEAMLYRSGAIDQRGSVEDGTTSSDFTAEEKRRKISIYTTVHPIEWKGHAFNVLDTPGYADFVGEIRGAQIAADAAMIVVSAVSGVAVGTERVWTSSLERELSTLLVINKMDRGNADFFRTMTDIEQSLPGNIAAIQIPIGQAAEFRGIVDLLHMKAWMWPEGKPREVPLPAEIAGVAQEYRERLVEAIVETDDDLMLEYLEDAEFDEAALVDAFYAAVRRDELTPVLVASATEAMGIGLLLDFMTDGVRGVEDHAPLPTVSGEPPVLGPGRPFGARVFKTSIDPYLGKISMMRVLAGRVKAGDTVLDVNRDQEVRLTHLYVPAGKDLREVAELTAGMIGAVTKLDAISTGDTLATRKHPFELPPIRLPSPVMALALTPKSHLDEDKMSDALHKLLDADSTLAVERNPDTRETVLWGMGHVHLETAIHLLAERYGVEVETRLPSIAYQETIEGRGDARHRHKKQSGGAGQFGEVALRVEPLARGEGFDFAWEVTGGAIPTQFQASCEKGVSQALSSGVLAGYPVTDVRVVVHDGKSHPVDSKDIAFQVGASMAFKEAMRQARPALLEPVALVKVRVPDRFTGDVISDLNTRRGRILGMDTEGSVSVVSAHVPVAEIQTYSAELRSLTGGRGAFSRRLDHHAPLPAHLAERVLQGRAETEKR